MSGGVADRPSFNAMLDFIKRQNGGVVVVIDDISRFARDIESHWALRRTLKEMGGHLESPNLKFGEDSDSVLVENLLASVSQHQRQKNDEQTKNRMRARVMNGYWVSHAPRDFKYERKKGHGKLLGRDEPLASIVQEALEGFASGRFETRAEVKRFLEVQPNYPKTRHGHVTNEEVDRLMKRPHYAGYVEMPDWGVSLRKGRHEGIVSVATWQAVQDRLNGKAKAPARADINADFPLRGFILCGDCDNPLTACWSKSKTGKKHPYYHCFTKGCQSHRKSIKRDQLEGDFERLLVSLRPSVDAFRMAHDMFKDAWEQRRTQIAEITKTAESQLTDMEAQITGLLDRIVEASSPCVVAAYETRIDELERDKFILSEKIATSGKPQRSFEEMFELAMRFLANPWNIWEKGDLTLGRCVLRMCFQGRVAYCRNQGLRTPETTSPFKVLGQFCGKESHMAERAGFEPAIELPLYTLSRRAPSTARPPLRRADPMSGEG